MKKITREEFILKANHQHNDRYVYDLTNYIDCKTKVKIICKEHGVFEQSPDAHLNGKGCPLCNGGTKINTNIFIERANKKHNSFYDYSLTLYENSLKDVIIICPVHGKFNQRPANHLNGAGCCECIGRSRVTTLDFIIKSNVAHNNKYDYSLTEYVNMNSKVKIICHQHGIFEQLPVNHLKGVGCPKCRRSKGEMKIVLWLENNGIMYEEQKKFKDCRGKRNILPFDFFLPEYNLCIEFDGKQHFDPIRYSKNGNKNTEKFEERQLYDNLKTKYCKTNDIMLLRIPYYDIKNIDDILLNNIKLTGI